MNQRELFDTATLATKCPICGAQKQPDQTRTVDCGIDQSRAAGDWLKRPNECLNMPRPETNPIPY